MKIKYILLVLFLMNNVLNGAQAPSGPVSPAYGIGWQSLPPELKDMIGNFFITHQIRLGTLDPIINEIKDKRRIDTRFRNLIDKATPDLIEYLAYKFRDTVGEEILRVGSYHKYEFNIAKKFGTPVAQAWIEKRKKEIPQEELLFKAIDDGNLQEVSKLLASGVNSNSFDNDGFPALVNAVELIDRRDLNIDKKRIDIIKLLLQYKANPNLVDLNKTTALHHVGLSPEVAKLLLEHGAQVNAISKQNLTPIISATARITVGGEKTLEVMRILLSAGANPNIKGIDFNNTALDVAIAHDNEAAINLLKIYNAKRGSEI